MSERPLRASAVNAVLIVRGSKILVYDDDRMPAFDPRGADQLEGAIPLGGYTSYLVIDASPENVATELSALLGRATRFIDPMFDLGRYEPDLRAVVLRALALSKWANEMRACSLCARPLRWDAEYRSRSCDNAPPHRHFPRTDPATIMLVSDGDRILLGRQSTWPAGMYSTLAGFVDAGESAEAAVAREVREEAGIEVDDVRYFGSEAWPFPRSLMLGFTARATTLDITCGEELDDVRWFDAERARNLMTELQTRMPFADTIARRLIAAWVRER